MRLIVGFRGAIASIAPPGFAPGFDVPRVQNCLLEFSEKARP